MQPLPFLEAIAWARARSVILPDIYYGELQGLARSMAFSIAGLTKLDQLQAVMDSLADATANGESFGRWRKRAIDPNGDIRLTLPPHRVENVFRTNIGSHYARGRGEQQRAVADAFPYLMLDAVNDSRTRPSHAALDGKVARQDDPFWNTHRPPLGYQCFLPGTRVEGDFEIGLKAVYSGKAVEIITAKNVSVSVTANHPILTRRGWVSAKDVQEGDDLLRYEIRGKTKRGSARVVDDQNSPPSVEDVFDALATQRLGVIPRSAFDLYGDALALKSDVDVAGANGVLLDAGSLASRAQSGKRLTFKFRNHVRPALRNVDLNATGGSCGHVGNKIDTKQFQSLFNKWARDAKPIADFLAGKSSINHALQIFIKMKNAPFFAARPRGAALALDQRSVALHCLPFERFGFAFSAQCNALTLHPIANCLTANLKIVSNRFQAFASCVTRDHGLPVFRAPARCFDRPAAAHCDSILRSAAFHSSVAEQSAKQAVTDFSLYEQLANRCAGLIERDQVASVRHFAFSGHVYDFETRNGLIAANGMITSNCRCRTIALTERQAARFIQADATRMLNPEAATARANARPDPGWDYDILAEPTEGLRRAWAAKVGKAHPALAQAAQASMDAAPSAQVWAMLEGDAATLDEIKRLGAERLDEMLALVTPDDRDLFPAMTDRGRSMADLVDSATTPADIQGVLLWWREAIWERLDKVRSLGGRLPITNKSGMAKDITERVAAKLPSSWINAIDATQPYKVQYKAHTRGWHNGATRKIELPQGSTAEHEWIHAIQAAMPKLDALFQEEHRRRTAGDPLKWLGDPYGQNEIGREDRYVGVYFGKEYGARGALEVITMTYQALLGEDFTANQLLGLMLKKDPDLIRLALGALFHFK